MRSYIWAFRANIYVYIYFGIAKPYRIPSGYCDLAPPIMRTGVALYPQRETMPRVDQRACGAAHRKSSRTSQLYDVSERYNYIYIYIYTIVYVYNEAAAHFDPIPFGDAYTLLFTTRR